jgi:hypothetical protein
MASQKLWILSGLALFLFLMLFLRLIINASVQTPVIIPTVKDTIIRIEGSTAINSNNVIIRHITTAKHDTINIKFLFFISRSYKEPRYI